MYAPALAALLCVAAAALPACSDAGHPCQVDSDCESGSACFEQTCYTRCDGDDECAEGDCEAHTRQAESARETVRICVDEDFDADRGASARCGEPGECCDDDAECAEELNDDNAVCGDHDRCYIPVEPAHGLLITDRTDRDDEDGSDDSDESGPGAEIAYVYVRRPEDDEPVGYGVRLDYAPVDGVDGPGEPLDGTPRPLDDQGHCVDTPFEESAVALGGDGGRLLVGVDDDDARPLELRRDWEVVVVEWGDNCGVDDDPDRYEVHLCEAHQIESDDDTRGIEPASDCEQRLSPEGGSAGRAVLPLDGL